MKKLLTALTLSVLSFSNVYATSGVTESGNHLVVNLATACSEFHYTPRCEIPDLGLVITCTTGHLYRSGSTVLYCEDQRSTGEMVIQSSIYPIGEIASKYVLTKSGDKYRAGSNYKNYYNYTMDNVFDLTIVKGDGYPMLNTISLVHSINNNLYNATTHLNDSLFSTYRYVIQELNTFKGNIKLSDVSHTNRFEQALREGMELLSAKDKDNEYAYSVLDWRIQENSRMIIAFGMILDELLAEYAHIDRLRGAIENMRVLVAELQRAYGWNRGLVGNVSKASSTLLEVIRLEISELGKLQMLIGGNTATYGKMLQATGTLLSKVNASDSGDMKAQREIWPFVDAWNSEEWQAELTKLLNAGPDERGLVIPKLYMLMKAMESMQELTDAGFELVPVQMQEIN